MLGNNLITQKPLNKRGGPEIHSTFRNENDDEDENRQAVDENEEIDEKLEFESFKKFLNTQTKK